MNDMSDRADPVVGAKDHEPSASERRLEAILHRAYRATPPPRLDSTILAALHTDVSTKNLSLAPNSRRLLTGRSLASVGAALVLLMGGTLGYQRLNGPAAVSAQTVLSRAAAAMRLAPGEAAHLTYTVTIAPPAQTDGSTESKGPLLSQADVWVQTASAGAATLSAQSLSVPEGAANPGQTAQDKTDRSGAVWSGPPVLARYLQIGQQTYGYDGGNNAIVIPGSHDQHPGWMIPNAALDGAGVAQELTVLAQRSPQQVHLLPEQTLDGIVVDVLRVDGWTDAPAMRSIFYFDGQSFLLRGFDAASNDPSYPTPSWQVRLTGYSTMAAAAVPPQTFALNAPATAHIDAPRVDLAEAATTFRAACHSTLAVAQLEQIVQTKQQSLLAACQSTAPTESLDDLVRALIAPYRVTLQGAAAAVQITQAQISAALATQQQWLDTLLTVPGGGSSLQ